MVYIIANKMYNNIFKINDYETLMSPAMTEY